MDPAGGRRRPPRHVARPSVDPPRAEPRCPPTAMTTQATIPASPRCPSSAGPGARVSASWWTQSGSLSGGHDEVDQERRRRRRAPRSPPRARSDTGRRSRARCPPSAAAYRPSASVPSDGRRRRRRRRAPRRAPMPSATRTVITPIAREQPEAARERPARRATAASRGAPPAAPRSRPRPSRDERRRGEAGEDEPERHERELEERPRLPLRSMSGKIAWKIARVSASGRAELC